MSILNRIIYTQDTKQLINLLSEWNFLDIPDAEAKDEYTDLAEPILRYLNEGDGASSPAEFIKQEIDKRYGVKLSDQKVSELTNKIADWWQNK